MSKEMPADQHIILLAEENADDALFLKQALKQVAPGFRLVHVPDRAEAIRYLKGEAPYDDRTRSPRPDFLVLDLLMSGDEGFKLLGWLREHPKEAVPAIVLTGFMSPTLRARSLDLGAREFHTKSASFADLLDIAGGLCERWGGADPADAG